MSGGRSIPPSRRFGDTSEAEDPFRSRPVRSGPLRVLRQVLLSLVVLLGSVALGVTAVLGIALYKHAHPRRVTSAETPASLFTNYEDVTFASSDGVSLAGWWIPGKDGLPPLILCHDLGESRSSLLGLASRLAEEHYPVLLFDFRGHGASRGTSSFGALEKRDLLGAIDWIVSHTKADGSRIGVVGIGMGAYAGILAASERPQVKCLALDSPYRDAETEFAAASIPEGLLHRWVKGWSGFLYGLVYRVRPSEENAGRRVSDLKDRNLLFLAPQGQETVTAASRALYDSVGESRNSFKNLQMLPATRTTALYGEDRDRYDQALIAFFRSYLPPAPRIVVAPVEGRRSAASR